MTLEVRATVDPTVQTQKPEDTIKFIQRNLKRQQGTIQELAETTVLPYGNTWCPGVFSKDGVRSNEEWIEQQVFAIDIDNKDKKTKKNYPVDHTDFVSLDMILDTLQKVGILPSFIYTTFSEEYNNKFRVVFTMREVITDLRVHKVIYTALHTIIPGADPSCTDPARMLYGGKKLVYTNYSSTIDILDLIIATTNHIRSTDAHNATRKIKDWCIEVGLNMSNGLPDVGRNPISNFEETPGHYSIYTVAGCFLNFTTVTKTAPKGTYKYVVENAKGDVELLKDVDWDALIERCPLLTDFFSGEWKTQPIAFAILTNLMYIEGGRKRFLDTIKRYWPEYYDYWPYCFSRSLGRYTPYNYTHDTIKEYYPDAAKVAKAKSILEAAKLKNREIRVYETLKEVPREDVMQDMARDSEKAFISTDTKVHVFNPDVGAGKTKTIIDLLVNNPHKPTVAAFPYHTLKDEVADRLRAEGVTPIVIPELPESVASVIDAYYKVGAMSSANVVLRDMAKTNSDVADYIAVLDGVSRLESGVILTTHARLLHLKTKIQTYIIDEDILKTLVSVKSVSLRDIYAVTQMVKPKGFGASSVSPIYQKYASKGLFDALTSVVDYIEKASPSFLQSMLPATIDLRVLERLIVSSKNISGDILSFLSCSHFIKSVERDEQGNAIPGTEIISFVQRRDLPEDKNILVFSATANEQLYAMIFNDRLVFYGYDHIQRKGTVEQYADKTYSRNWAKTNDEVDTIIDTCIEDGYDIITFMSLDREGRKLAAWFGAVEGIDTLKGKKIAVIGTPRVNGNMYLLFAAALGVKLVGLQSLMNNHKICRNGFEFRFMCYDNPELREIQLWFIETELEQSIGRARLIWFDTTVRVYSDFPVRGAKILYTR